MLGAGTNSNGALFLHTNRCQLGRSLAVPSSVRVYKRKQDAILVYRPAVQATTVLLNSLSTGGVAVRGLMISNSGRRRRTCSPGSKHFCEAKHCDGTLTKVSVEKRTKRTFDGVGLGGLAIVGFSESKICVSSTRKVRVSRYSFARGNTRIIPNPELRRGLVVRRSSGVVVGSSQFSASVHNYKLILSRYGSLGIRGYRVTEGN